MIRVFTNYYLETYQPRKDEHDICIKHNKNNPLIEYIFTPTRVFGDIVKIADEMCSDNDVNIITNLDMYFDETVSLVENILPDEFLCLSRWDVAANGTAEFKPTDFSQNAWCWRGKARPMNLNFTLGQDGCDNRMVYEAHNAGYKVLNLGREIKTYHMHLCDRRTTAKFVDGPYAVIEPDTHKLEVFDNVNSLMRHNQIVLGHIR